MSETEKKDEGQKCHCCQCFKAIFMAIVLLAIGFAFGHVAAMRHCRPMMGPWGGGHCMKACWDREGMGRECNWEHKFQGEKEVCGKEKGGWFGFGHKADTGKGKPCPMKGAGLAEPEKGSCPMMGKKECKPEKD